MRSYSASQRSAITNTIASLSEDGSKPFTLDALREGVQSQAPPLGFRGSDDLYRPVRGLERVGVAEVEQLPGGEPQVTVSELGVSLLREAAIPDASEISGPGFRRPAGENRRRGR
jgi:hypothetical protein